MNALAQLITTNNILLDIEASSREELFQFVGQLFEENFGIASSVVENCLLDRENLGSTGLGHGLAIPHGRVKNLSDAHLAFIRTRQGIDFKAPDQEMVKAFVVMLVPEQATQEHLEILSQVAQVLSDNETKALLFTETNRENIHQLLTTLKK
jgi:PTS system nitrogen regulatory IIA component